MERNLPNILIEEKGESLTYVPVNGGDGEPNYPVRNNRRSHASYLKRQLEDAWQSALDEAANVAVTTTRDGVYLQIEGKEGYDLVTKSLEDARQHVRLLNIREEEGLIRATVFVPLNKQDFFLKKINKYAETETGSDVIATIEKINAAMVTALWIGNRETVPGEAKTWCEIWLRYEMDQQPDEVVSSFFEVCNQCNIEYKDKKIVFPERVIVLANANADDLKKLMLMSGSLAEIRKLITPINFFTEMSSMEQREWAEELQGRLDFSKGSNTAICLLDTGVNNAHPLLQPILICKISWKVCPLLKSIIILSRSKY